MSLYSMCQHLCDVDRPTSGQDAAGGTTRTFRPVARQLPCAVNMGGAGDVDLYAQPNARCGATLEFPLTDPQIQRDDRLTITEVLTGRTYLATATGRSVGQGRGRLYEVPAVVLETPVADGSAALQ